jgi:hypothetical protein
MLASLITLPQRGISVLRNSRYCSGVLARGSSPTFFNFSWCRAYPAMPQILDSYAKNLSRLKELILHGDAAGLTTLLKKP